MSNKKTYADYARRYADDLYAPYNPTGAFPIDVRSFFESFEEAQEAAKTAVAVGGAGSTYYHGQLVGVLEYPDGIDHSASGVANYYIIQPTGILSPIGSGNANTVGLEFTEPMFDDPTQQWYCKVKGLGACKDSEIYIPAISPSGAIVNGIVEGAFYNTNITKVVIPATVLTIADSAFYRCANLETVELNEGLIYVGNFGFSNCPKLTKISFPNTVASLGTYVLADCSELVELQLSTNLSSIGMAAFSGCTKLKTLLFYDATTALPRELLKGCSSLESIVLPANIDLAEDSIFEHCKALTTIYYAGNFSEWEALPKSSSTWAKGATGTIWYLKWNPSSSWGTQIVLVPEFADNIYEINIKMNSKVAGLDAALINLQTTTTTELATHTSEMTTLINSNHSELSTALDNLDTMLNTAITESATALDSKITTLSAATTAQFDSVGTKLADAGDKLISFSAIDTEEDSFCLTLDPSVFGSNT
jgi:hypothetical protein